MFDWCANKQRAGDISGCLLPWTRGSAMVRNESLNAFTFSKYNYFNKERKRKKRDKAAAAAAAAFAGVTYCKLNGPMVRGLLRMSECVLKLKTIF